MDEIKKEKIKIPKIKITSGLIDTNRLFEMLNKLQESVDVNFTDDGNIPEYIEFDRNDIDLYNTIEEILTVFINDRESNIRHYIDDLIHFDDSMLIIVLSSLLFNDNNTREMNIVEWYNKHQQCEEIAYEFNELDLFLSTTREKYMEYIDNRKGLTSIKSIHLSRVSKLEKVLTDVKYKLFNMFDVYINTSYNDISNNIKLVEFKKDVCTNVAYFKNSGLTYIDKYIDARFDSLTKILRAEYHRARTLYELDQIL